MGPDQDIELILNNFSCHEAGNVLPPNIRIEYLPPNTTSKLQPCDQGIIQTLKAHTRRANLRSILDFIDKYPTYESHQYYTKKGDLRTRKFAPDVRNAITFITSAWQTVSTTTIHNYFRKAGIRHQDPGLLAFSNPLMEVTEILDVIKVDMARIRPNQTATLMADSLHFISPNDEIVEDNEEVTLERLLEPYRPTTPSPDNEDDSEPPQIIPASELQEALATVKLYVQQQWDPGMLSLAFEVVDETAIAVQQDLHNLERHLITLQLRKPQRQTPITSYFQPSSSSSAADHAAERSGRRER